ncbi:hypothetical protein PGTUg99_012575 [Puccinia graminis f. sp. tritici]|uniref:Alpha-type protein kinase domain-containing protein n=1 Tax=Puccinia graminis f. sp. tritici TaxID=56615 RepID=A0A5B0RES8_PUCGR|nr:hypothetical protein PGTUg99_012575 [Puccinia graminis f. sp. tritici]
MRAGAWISPSDPNCHQVLLQSLCNRHEGCMELQIKNQDDRLFFSEKHFAFCRLGTRKGSVLDQDSFVEYLKNNKSIDLLLDYDKFYEHELDEEERQGIESVSRHHSRQSRTSVILESQPSTPSVTSTFPTSISRANSTNPIVQVPLPNGMSTTDLSTSITPATHLSPSESPEVPNMVGKVLDSESAHCIEPTVIMQKLPPWISMHILDPNDLTWDRFGTPGRSSVFRGKPDVGWTDGVRHQLDPDGLYVNEKLCPYRVNYYDTLATKKTSKVIGAEIYDSGFIYPMVAEYTLFRKNLNHDTYLTEPTYAMRTYALARQFLSLFCNTIKSSEAQPAQKQLAEKLRIIDGFPVHQDICYRPEEDNGSSWLADRDIIELPVAEASNGENKRDFLEAEPTRVFFFQERIEGYRKLLCPEDIYYCLSENSSTIDLLLHAFQHWVYSTTSGQMTITNFRGNPPLITKPKVILGPMSRYEGHDEAVPLKSYLHPFVSSTPSAYFS